MELDSKLPHVGTTIFTVMTQRAHELGAVNLSQGFPDYDPPPQLKERLAHHVACGDHQYAPMSGVAALREQIAIKQAKSAGLQLDPEHEITITLGATEAIFSAVMALVRAGDEVILFDPAYDSYAPAILLAGGRPIHIPLLPPAFTVDWQRLSDALSSRTRLVIINSPHNPTGAVLSSAEMDQLEQVLLRSNAYLISDEVYDHLIFDGRQHVGLLSRPALYERGIAVFSFGKTMHATGWRVGYAVAPPALTRELRRVHQFNTFTIATPLQHAIADFMRDESGYYDELAAFYQRKRDFFLERLAGSRFKWTPSPGTYFQLLDYSAIADVGDMEFVERLIQTVGVASIPVSPFYAERSNLRVIRLCFAKTEATLAAAAQRLCSM